MASQITRTLMGALAAFVFSVVSQTTVSAQEFSGPSIGVHVGHRWVDADLTTPPYVVNFIPIPARSESYSLDGTIIGMHLGYMIRLSPNWHIGVEGDISAGRGNDRLQAAFGIPQDEVFVDMSSHLEANWQGTLRLRLGYASGQWMLYFTGGIAVMDIEWFDSITPAFSPTFTASKSELLTGWVLGLGVDFALNLNWLLRAEYLYEDLGSMTVPLAGTSTVGELDVTAQKLRFGITYRFD